MRIASWNVNGVRSAIRKGIEDWLSANQYDLVCLQETKSQEDLLSRTLFDPYSTYWNTSVRPGYSGVATLVAPHLIPSFVRKGIGDNTTDSEGRVLTLGFERFTLVNVYAPHSHRELTRLEVKIEFCCRFLKYVDELRAHGKPLIIVGDLNVAHNEIDLSNPAANKNNAGFLPAERAWMTALLDVGYVDAFRLFNCEGGHFTWWSLRKGVRERNIGWRLDYILVDETISSSVNECLHHPAQFGSDHCPVSIEMDI
jgi:exodeoxyribonuclease-3